MAKKVSFDKPTRRKQPNLDADAWVATGGTSTEGDENGATKSRKTEKEEISQTAQVKTKRFTIDIPTALHARIKAQCAIRGVKMKEEIQALLESRFAQ